MMKMILSRVFKTILCSIFLVALFAVSALAVDTDTTDLTTEVGYNVLLWLSTDVAGNTDLNVVTFNIGLSEIGTVLTTPQFGGGYLQHRSNCLWYVTITQGATPAGYSAFPSTMELWVWEDSDSSHNEIYTGCSFNMASGGSAGGAQNQVDLNWRICGPGGETDPLGWDIPPGSYGKNVIFTMTGY